jgi:hypothetical protein
MSLFYIKDILFVILLGVCAWFSYRKGWKSGIEEGIEAGMEESFEYLESLGYIRIEELSDGNIKIHKA